MNTTRKELDATRIDDPFLHISWCEHLKELLPASAHGLLSQEGLGWVESLFHMQPT